jgi:hypothetical protein
MVSTSMGTGFPGVGRLCACLWGREGTGGRAGRAAADKNGAARAATAGAQYDDWKASLVALLSSIVRAMLYHADGSVLDGLPEAMVATVF